MASDRPSAWLEPNRAGSAPQGAGARHSRRRPPPPPKLQRRSPTPCAWRAWWAGRPPSIPKARGAPPAIRGLARWWFQSPTKQAETPRRIRSQLRRLQRKRPLFSARHAPQRSPPKRGSVIFRRRRRGALLAGGRLPGWVAGTGTLPRDPTQTVRPMMRQRPTPSEYDVATLAQKNETCRACPRRLGACVALGEPLGGCRAGTTLGGPLMNHPISSSLEPEPLLGRRQQRI